MKNTKRLAAGVLAAVMMGGSLASCQKGEEVMNESAAPEAAVGEEISASPWTESKHRLEFDESGEFRILVFSDIHISGEISALAKSNMEKLVNREEPDLVLFGGDNTWGITSENGLRTAVASMVSVLEEKQIPWAHVYGNHDCENNNLAKEKQQAIYESFEYCISQAGPEDLFGQGNYVLPVYGHGSEKVLFNVWGLDSGEYISSAERAAYMPVAGTYQGYQNSTYDYIKPAQIRWYTETSEAMEEYNGAPVPGMMIFHIPLQEFYNAWVNREALEHTGEKREVVCAGEVNSGMFMAMQERGDIKAVVSGHDHRNDYMVKYGGIKLCYCSTVSETGYCDMDMLGARMFVISEENPGDVQTYMSYTDDRKMGLESGVIDADPIESGVILNFDTYTPEMDKSSWPNDVSAAAKPDQIVAEIAEGRGLDGSKALAVTRKNFDNSNQANNAEVRITMEKPGLLGDNKYLRVWMDFTGDNTQVDMRKACWGLVENNYTVIPYGTDEKDTPSPFWYLPDGETEWKKMSHGNDGCFGEQQASSVKGLKGWFAFPIENMLERGSLDQLTEESCITHVYFYFCLSSAEMKNNRVYIDDISLVKDYTVFD